MVVSRIVKIDPLNPEERYLKEAARIVARGGLVIIPTETVYGIAANMLNKNTIEKLYRIKQRPQDKPFSLHIAEETKVEDYARNIPVAAYRLMDKFWPGPLTLILKAVKQGTIALRMPDNQLALKIIAYARVPVVCPSANISGKAAPVSFREAIGDLKEEVDFAIDAGGTSLGIESSVVDLTVTPAQVIREGALKKEAIEAELKKKTVLFVCTGNSCRSVMAEGLLKDKIKEKGRSDIDVLSAGIMMLDGLGASPETRQLLKTEGIDVSGHRSQRVTKDMLRRADLILVMERLHEESILQLDPEVKNRVFLLKEFAKIDDDDLNITDPIGRSVEFYAHTLGIIKEAVDRIEKVI